MPHTPAQPPAHRSGLIAWRPVQERAIFDQQTRTWQKFVLLERWNPIDGRFECAIGQALRFDHPDSPQKALEQAVAFLTDRFGPVQESAA